MILYGIIALLIVLGIMTFISFRSISNEKYALATVLVVISISAVVEQRLLDVSYDPFLIALLAEVYAKDKSKNIIGGKS